MKAVYIFCDVGTQSLPIRSQKESHDFLRHTVIPAHIRKKKKKNKE